MHQDTPQFSDKSYGLAVCLAFIFGILGVHHFYLGRWFHGAADLGMSLLGFFLVFQGEPRLLYLGIGVLLIDYIHTVIVSFILLVGAYRDGRGRLVPYPGQVEKMSSRRFD